MNEGGVSVGVEEATETVDGACVTAAAAAAADSGGDEQRDPTSGFARFIQDFHAEEKWRASSGGRPARPRRAFLMAEAQRGESKDEGGGRGGGVSCT